MSLLIGQPHQQVCTKCRWKNKMIFTSDCIIGDYEECPKCGSQTIMEPLTDFKRWSKRFDSFSFAIEERRIR